MLRLGEREIPKSCFFLQLLHFGFVWQYGPTLFSSLGEHPPWVSTHGASMRHQNQKHCMYMCGGFTVLPGQANSPQGDLLKTIKFTTHTQYSIYSIFYYCFNQSIWRGIYSKIKLTYNTKICRAGVSQFLPWIKNSKGSRTIFNSI